MKDNFKKVGKGVLWAVLPVSAWKQLKSSKDSVGRIIDLARRRGVKRDPSEMSEVELAKHKVEEAGRAFVLQMEEHDRFEYMARELGWTREAIEKEARSLARGHAIRFSLLVFCLVMGVGLTAMFGFRPFVFGSAAALYLSATCIRTACMYTQLNERALWSLRQLTLRPNFWLWRRAFWFLT